MPTKILVVDDSATMRRVLQMTFAGEDAQVVAVDSGDAGVAKAGEIAPDVVFADASMAMDARDTCCLSILSHSPCSTPNAIWVPPGRPRVPRFCHGVRFDFAPASAILTRADFHRISRAAGPG